MIYKHHSIALNEKDQKIYEAINKKTGLGVTAIFREALKKYISTGEVVPVVVKTEEE